MSLIWNVCDIDKFVGTLVALQLGYSLWKQVSSFLGTIKNESEYRLFPVNVYLLLKSASKKLCVIHRNINLDKMFGIVSCPCPQFTAMVKQMDTF